MKRYTKVFSRDEDGGYKVLTVPAIKKEKREDMVSSRCGHEFDCCGCQFIAWVRSFYGLYSITAVYRNV